MVEFVCDRENIKTLFHKLHHLSEQEGAIFHKELVFHCHDGQFNVRAASPIEEGQSIVSMPLSAFVPIQDVTFGVHGRQLVIESCAGLSVVQSEVLELVFEIYNAADKFEHYKKRAITRLYFEEPELFEALMQRYRPSVPKNAVEKPGRRNKIFLNNFMILRTIDIEPDQFGILKAASLTDGATEAKPFVPVERKALAPFIEYFNHHPRGYPINGNVDEETQKKTANIRAYAPADKPELFFRYGFSDAHQQYICQSYVDENSFFTRCLPMVFDVPGLGTLEIGAQMVRRPKHEIPEGYQDLSFYFPNVNINKKAKKIFIGGIKIPMGDAPRSMRRILYYAFSQISNDDNKIHNAILYAERHMVEQTIAYYEQLQTLFAGYKPKPSIEPIILDIRKMLDTQLCNIRAYSFSIESLAA